VLTGGGTNGSVTVGLDAEHSLPQGCDAGTVPKAGAGSTWYCGIDNDHEYFPAANGGLYQSGNTFGIQSNYRLPQGCNFGQIAVQRNGFWGCDDQEKSPIREKIVQFVDVPQSGWTEVARMPLSSGTWLVTVNGIAEDDSSGNNEVSIECQLYRDSTRWADSKVDIGDQAADSGPAGALTSTSVIGAPAGAWLYLNCTSHTGSDHITNLTLTAVPVGIVTNY